MSDADFSFSQRKLVLTSPSSGDEQWPLRSEQTLTWSSNIGGNVKLELSHDGFATATVITGSTLNNGSYAWTVDKDLVPGANYLARITSLEPEADSDTSDNPFAITDDPFVKITSPVGNERWAFGTAKTISWTSNMSADTANDVRIDLYNAGAWVKSVAARTSNTGSYAWTLPGSTEVTAGANYSIKITCVEQAFVTTQSPSTFEIGAAFVTQMSPNGGETLIAGAQRQVTWNSNIGGTVKLELYNGLGNFAATIAAAAPQPRV